MTNYSDMYKRFINLAVAAEKLLEYPKLDPTETKILNLLITYWQNKQAITVVETMHMTNEISTSTVFRYLKTLRKKGYIELAVDEIDNRVKYVQATKQTEDYFAKLGKLMVKAIK
jgi:DNA-binding MarR family transcriptional regulator